MPKTWAGDVPHADDVGMPIYEEFIDGRSKYGPWGLFTPSSWETHGCGRLGPSCGQRYRKDGDTWHKVEG